MFPTKHWKTMAADPYSPHYKVSQLATAHFIQAELTRSSAEMYFGTP